MYDLWVRNLFSIWISPASAMHHRAAEALKQEGLGS